MAAENGEVVYKKYLYACVARWYAFTAAEVTKAIPSPDEAEVVETEAVGEVEYQKKLSKVVDFEHVSPSKSWGAGPR